MRKIEAAHITQVVANLCIQACCVLPIAMKKALEDAVHAEKSPLGQTLLAQLLENAAIAQAEACPICQDTGLAVVFVDVGQEVHIVGGSLEDAVHEGVALGYTKGFLRKSCVEEPLFQRKNTGNNSPAIIHTRIVPGDTFRLVVAPKGAGSENKSALKMLTPADGLEGATRFLLDTVQAAGASACPPLVVGVGLGGTMEMAALYAKKAAIRDMDFVQSHPQYAELEQQWLEKINSLGIGPQGFGGSCTALRLHIEFGPCHIASLPMAVNINCHAARHAHAFL